MSCGLQEEKETLSSFLEALGDHIAKLGFEKGSATSVPECVEAGILWVSEECRAAKARFQISLCLHPLLSSCNSQSLVPTIGDSGVVDGVWYPTVDSTSKLVRTRALRMLLKKSE